MSNEKGALVRVYKKRDYTAHIHICIYIYLQYIYIYLYIYIHGL